MNPEHPIPRRGGPRKAGTTRTPAADPQRGPRRPKQARSRRTRQNILRAAIACFELHGYDGATTAAIAARAGVGVGTVYSYFENKRAILLEIVEDVLVPFNQAVVERLDPKKAGVDDPRATTRTLIDLIFEAQHLSPGMRRVLWERYFKDPEVREQVESVWARTREAVRAFLDELDRRGLLREIDVASATHVIHNAVQWNAWRAYEDGDPERTRAVAASTLDMISRFVFADDDDSRS